MKLNRVISGAICAAVVVVQVACSDYDGVPPPRASGSTIRASDVGRTAGTIAGAQTELPPRSFVDPALSPRDYQVSEIAARGGDRDFIMVDKALGKIILFKDSRPVFAGAALTGESTGDRLSSDALSEDASSRIPLADRVTPAGRFTVRPGYDKNYGPVFDINEIHGKHWAIAIHQVYLGARSEHRDARLRSPNPAEHRITYGCINVAPETMRLLVRELPTDRSTPIYILPRDEAETGSYFTPRGS